MKKLGTAIRRAAVAALISGSWLPTAALAQFSDKVVRIGVLNDQSGPFSGFGGTGSVDAVRMAVEDFGGSVRGQKIEVIAADHQNKADIGLSIARKWYDEGGVDTILDVPNSAVALAVQELSRERKKLVLYTGPGTSDLTGPACSPLSAAWTFDTYALSSGSAAAITEQGGNSWYFLTTDYAFGHALERDAATVVKAKGGTVVGHVMTPVDSTDFASFLLQAQASKAKIIGLATAIDKNSTIIKQSREFGLMEGGQQLAVLTFYIDEVHALGLEAAQGILLQEAFYWDQTDEGRAWSNRYFERNKAMPTMLQASPYSAAMHYLKAVDAAGTDEPEAVMKQMRAMPINDFMTKNARIREDGRVMRDMYLYQVKSPAESKYPWDYYKLVRTIPAEQAAPPLGRGCYLAKGVAKN